MTHRPEEIESRSFTISWRGYDRDQVRGFLRDVAGAIRGAEPAEVDAPEPGEPKLLDPSRVQWPDIPRPASSDADSGPVPETIEMREFSVSWRGYNRDEVRSFLREVADDVRADAPRADDTEDDVAALEPEAVADQDDTATDPDATAEADTEPEPTEVEVEVAIVERATGAAMAVRRDARRASTSMRHLADTYVEQGRSGADEYADQLRREADHYARTTRTAATELRRAAERDALTVRARLTAESSARLQARARGEPPEAHETPSTHTDDLATLEGADVHRLRTDLDRMRTTVSRLEAELLNTRAERDAARREPTAPIDEGSPTDPAAAEEDLARRQAALQQEERRLETLRAEVESLQANAVEQRAEAE
ncbi:MAG: DivIVA domain-containing protein, partial [Acidimicrobiia bacterium]|nr:DivIVA domain-containing protein [Acidimicrobiia bacterium]